MAYQETNCSFSQFNNWHWNCHRLVFKITWYEIFFCGKFSIHIFIFLKDSSVNSRKPIRRRGNPTLRRNSGNTRRKSSKVRSDCDVNAYVEDIELFVAEKSSTNNRDAEVKILEGQKEVYGAKDEKTFMTARTSQKPKKLVFNT